MLADIYDGNLIRAIAFVPVRRDSTNEKWIRSVCNSMQPLKDKYPLVDIDDDICSRNAFYVFDTAVVVVKGILGFNHESGETQFGWTTETGIEDANETIARRFYDTMPLEWKEQFQLKTAE
jgi:hypothetical protein